MNQKKANTSENMQLNLSSMAEEQDEKSQRDYTTSYALILIALVIITGNGLVLLTVKSFAKRLVADILIFVLAFLDLTHTLTSIILAIIFKFTLLHKSTEGSRRSIFNALCQTQGWFTVTTQLQSAFVITLITLERFLAVSRPFLYQSYVKPMIAVKTVAVLLVASIISSSAPLLGWGSYVPLPKLALCLFSYHSSYSIFIVSVGYIDLAVVLYCFLAIRVSLRKFMKRQTYFARRRGAIAGPQMERVENSSELTKQGAKSIEQSKRLLKVSAMVSLLFYMSWLPLMVTITFVQITHETNDVLSLIASLMPLLSPLVNPIIYFLSWERYKRSYIKIMKSFVKCRSYQRSSKDLTKVPGRNSTIRNLVRNSGLLGRPDLVECDDVDDMCCDGVLTPGPQLARKFAFDETTKICLGKSLGSSGKSMSVSSVEIRTYSYDDVPKNRRRHTMSECIHTDLLRDFHSFPKGSENFPKGSSSRNGGNRLHTIGEFSKDTAGSLEWRTGDVDGRSEIWDSPKNGSDPCESSNILQYREGYVTGSERETNSLRRRNYPAEYRKRLGRPTLNEVWDEQDAHGRRTSGERRDLKNGKEQQWDKKRNPNKSGEYLDINNRPVIDASVCGTCDEVTKNANKTEEESDERRTTLDTKRNYHKNNHIIDEDNFRTKKRRDQEKYPATDHCTITERIRDYLSNLVEDEESEDSGNINDGTSGQVDGTFPENWLVGKQTGNQPESYTVPEKKCSVTIKRKSDKASRVTSSLRHIYRRYHGNERAGSSSGNVETSGILRMFGPTEDDGKFRQAVPNRSEKYRGVSRNRKNLPRNPRNGVDRLKITEEKNTLIWTYL